MGKKTILLHTCCAPCLVYVHELLRGDYHIIPFYYNPNIAPRGEYDRRLEELKRFTRAVGLPLEVGAYDQDGWRACIEDFRFGGERSSRCWECYRYRMDGAFRMARETGADFVGTVMSISPHKDAGRLNAIGKELSAGYGTGFLEADFKKGDGFRKAAVLSAEYGFYRQDYCGCLYSRFEKPSAAVRVLRGYVRSRSVSGNSRRKNP